MPYEKTVWNTGDTITAYKMRKIEDELEALQNKQDSFDIGTSEEVLSRLDALEDLTAANVSEKELTTNDNFIIIPTDAAIEMGVFDMKVDLPLRQEEKDGDISPNNPKQFLPYNSIDFLLYNGNANLLDKKAAFESDTLFTFDANNRVTGTIGAFSEKRIKLPRGLAGQKIHFYCVTLGDTPTRLVFYRHMYNSGYSNEGSLAGSFYSTSPARTNISDYYTLPTLDGSLYDDIYMSIQPAQGSSVNYSDTLTLTIFSAALQQSNGSGEPTTTYINLSEPILAGQADFSTGIATNQSASTMAVYYLLNSADLNIESFVENTNGSNYVICTRPDGASENTRSSHYRYLNGSGEEFYFTPSDANAEYKFTIHDSRFTDEATAKRILGDSSNNINFAIVSSFLMPGINEKIVTSQIKSNRIIMPSIPSAIAAKDGNLTSLKYYQSSNAIMEDLQNQINTNKPHVMLGANQLMDGSEGYVPAPKRSTQDYNKFLSGSGQWQEITVPTYDNATAHTTSNPGFGLATNGKGLSIDNNNSGILNVNTSLSTAPSLTAAEQGDTYVDTENKLKVKMPLASTSQYGLVKIADDSYSNLINDSNGLRVPYYARSSIASAKHAGVITPPDYDRGPDLFFTSGGTWIDLFANLAQPYDSTKDYTKGEFIQYGDKIYQLNADAPAGTMWDATEVCYGDILKTYGLTLNGSLSSGRKSNTTIGNKSVAFGEEVRASGEYSHAEGSSTIASASNSHAEGSDTTANGFASHAEGTGTLASGSYGHAEGSGSIVYGSGSHAEGSGSITYGNGSHAEGDRTFAYGKNSHAEGQGRIVGGSIVLSGAASTRTYIYETFPSTISISNIKYCYISTGTNYDHIQEIDTSAKTITLERTLSNISIESQTFDIYYFGTTAAGSYAHVEGGYTLAEGQYSHAEGTYTKAQGPYSHVEGLNTMTSAAAESAHAEGEGSVALEKGAHAEGFYTEASGLYSHAEGEGTKAVAYGQHVLGAYNIMDSETPLAHGNYIEIVGNGLDDDTRRNARTLDWNGNEWLAGSLTLGNTTVTENQLKTAISPMTGATRTTDGAAGLVPAPNRLANNYYLRGDGTWFNLYETIANAILPINMADVTGADVPETAASYFDVSDAALGFPLLNMYVILEDGEYNDLIIYAMSGSTRRTIWSINFVEQLGEPLMLDTSDYPTVPSLRMIRISNKSSTISVRHKKQSVSIPNPIASTIDSPLSKLHANHGTIAARYYKKVDGLMDRVAALENANT